MVQRLKLQPLYRGDSLPNAVFAERDPRHRGRTWAEYYRTEGLMAKFNQGGNGWMDQKSLAWLVAAHVGYCAVQGASEEKYSAFHSPMISFSERPDAAFYFMDRTQRADFEPCELKEATHFLWKLDGIEADEVQPGRFDFIYDASTINVQRFLVSNGGQMPSMGDIAAAVVHKHINEDRSPHFASLIHVERFLTRADCSSVVPAMRSETLRCAMRDAEWLLYPKDPMPDGRGFSARLTLNRYLDLEHWMRKSVQP
jgi:hypothetical protein